MTMKSSRSSVAFKATQRLVRYLAAFIVVLTHVLWHYYSLQILFMQSDGNNSKAHLNAMVQENNSQRKHIMRMPSESIGTPGMATHRSEREIVHDKNTQIPQWMEDYFQWHSAEISTLNASNYAEQKYLLLRCLNMDNTCGGASDRLQTIPAIVLAAYRMKRLLFIIWERPYPLEEFLLPPKGGLNWTLPMWLDQQFTYQPRLEIVNEVHLRHAEQSTKQVIQTRFQASDYGAGYYNTNRPDGPLFDEVFHDCWERLFEPSPAVAALVIESTFKLGLVPGQYTAVHIRSKYMTAKAESRRLIQNAVNCGSQQSNNRGTPIYVAADDNRAIEYAMAYGSSKGGEVVGRVNEHPILHLDRGADFLSMNLTQPKTFPPSAYYETFVDFYMLAFSRCLSLHKGGFGRWAKLMMQNSSCFINHGKDTCTWGAD